MAYARPFIQASDPDGTTRPAAAMTPRLFTAAKLANGVVVELDSASAHHAVRVLRLAAGAPIELFDGNGNAAIALLVRTEPCTAVVERLLAPQPVAPLRLTLAQCISAADKMDWTIEKAVELGVSAIVPLQSHKAVVKLTPERGARRREHWQRLILAATAQSGQNRLPRLDEVMKLEDWLRQPAPGHDRRHDPDAGNARDQDHDKDRTGTGTALRLILDPRAQQSLSAVLSGQRAGLGIGAHVAPPGPQVAGPALEDIPAIRQANRQVHVLCGPESGFSDAEFSQAREAGWLAVGLGPRVLRTETAGLAALAILQAFLGDLR